MAEWTIGAARDLPVVAGDWDGAAAQARLFGRGEEIDQERARRGHLVYDAEAPALKGSYKLPFADVRDGRLVAVTGGLNAAASRLPQTDVPADVRQRAEAVLDAYRERRQRALKANVSEFGGSMDDFVSRVRREFDRQMRPPNQYDLDRPPESERPYVTDVFPDHCIVRAGDRYLSVVITVTDDASTGVEGIEFAPWADWQPVALQYVAEMPREAMREIMIVSEFKGKYPEVPFADGVDYKALVDGDDDPVFITVPIGKADVTSGNKRYYDDAFLTELERQVLANRPVGLMGHLRPEQRATEFPMEAVHWVGARRIGGLLWGKGYVPAGDARARLLRYKATNKQIATSIDALAEGVWDDDLGAYRMSAKSLKLNQIDIAPADRAGIADLAAVPHVTTEMAARNLRESEKESEMDREEIIRSLTVEEVPTPLREQIAAGAAQELRNELGLSDDADIVAHVRELHEAETQRAREIVDQRIQELVEDAENGIKLESARGLIVELVQARLLAQAGTQSVEDAEEAYKAVVESESVKTLLEMQVRGAMGPRQTTNVRSQKKGSASSQWWDDAPAKEA